MRLRKTHDFLFHDGPQGRLADLPHHAFETALARIRGRNPPFPPWWRRYVGTWQTFADGDGESDGAAAGAGGADERGRRPLLYGLCQAWNEDDVIYATVRNLFLQGADEVFVIDDASDDDTPVEARAAGATVIGDASDGTFDEVRRTRRIAEVIEERSAAADRDVWWIMVDADEFPRGPGARTIRDLALALPPSVDTIGSRVLEHYPSGRSEPRRRHHPLDELPLAHWHVNPACPAGHWKHQMMRVREPGELRFMMGRHTIAAPAAGKPVVESRESLLMHHFPLRARWRTEERFRTANSPAGRYGGSGNEFRIRRVETRLRTLALCYAEEYESLPVMYPGERRFGVEVRDWRGLVGARERDVRHRPGHAL